VTNERLWTRDFVTISFVNFLADIMLLTLMLASSKFVSDQSPGSPRQWRSGLQHLHYRLLLLPTAVRHVGASLRPDEDALGRRRTESGLHAPLLHGRR
jgi:hypothetical protein